MGEAQADELDPETDTMVYSPVEGKFVDKEDGDPEDQMGILNWIADNPVKSSVMAMPAMYGIGVGANKLGAAKTAAYLTNWKAMIPAMMVPEKLWQYREGESLGEMTTDPWNAIWALGIDSNASLAKKGQYYINLIKDPALKARLAKEFADAGGNLAKKAAIGKQAFEITGANILGKGFWGSKNKMAKLGQSFMSPAAAGTDLAFNKRLIGSSTANSSMRAWHKSMYDGSGYYDDKNMWRLYNAITENTRHANPLNSFKIKEVHKHLMENYAS